MDGYIFIGGQEAAENLVERLQHLLSEEEGDIYLNTPLFETPTIFAGGLARLKGYSAAQWTWPLKMTVYKGESGMPWDDEDIGLVGCISVQTFSKPRRQIEVVTLSTFRSFTSAVGGTLPSIEASCRSVYADGKLTSGTYRGGDNVQFHLANLFR